MKRNTLAGWLWTLALGPLAGVPAFAQGTQGPIPPKPGVPIQKAPPGTIIVKVEEVSAPVVVRDAKGELVVNLQQKDFKVFDSGVQQTITGFSMGGDPISLVIVVETSSRIAALMPAIQKTGILFTQVVLGDTGDAAILGYHDAVDTLLPFTSDTEKIEKAVTNLAVQTSGSRLYDALANGVEMLSHRPKERRRVIIAIGEAVDTGSEEKLGEVLRAAQLANVTIYTVGLSSTAAEWRGQPKQAAAPSITPPGTFPTSPTPGTVQTPDTDAARYGSGGGGGGGDLLALAVWVVQHAKAAVKSRQLEIATAATGGSYQSTFRDRSIESAIDAIGGELHAQYMVSYRPPSANQAGYHEIEVRVDRSGVTVRTRPGYYLESSGN